MRNAVGERRAASARAARDRDDPGDRGWAPWQSGAMGDSLDDELTALRRRAYGPDADITADHHAVTRLRALEERVRVRGRVLDPPPGVPAPEPTTAATTPDAPRTSAAAGSPADAPAAAPGEALPSDGSDGTTAPPPRRRAWRTVVAACALTAVGVVAVTVPITLWVAALPEQPYAILHPIDAPPNTVFFSPESEAQRYEDFLGMHVSTGALDYEQGRCILVELQPDRNDEFDSRGTRGACSAPGFEAVIDVSTVDGDLSATARAALGDVTAVRFAVVGDEVHVFVANAPDPGTES